MFDNKCEYLYLGRWKVFIAYWDKPMFALILFLNNVENSIKYIVFDFIIIYLSFWGTKRGVDLKKEYLSHCNINEIQFHLTILAYAQKITWIS